jgi:hypothetical protein
VFDLSEDVWEMNNLIGTPVGDSVSARDMPLGVYLSSCTGAHCSNPKPATIPKKPLPCKNTTKGILAPGDIAWD